MKLTELEPNVYWQTSAIDLVLGRAVQAAYREGQQTAHSGHQAEQAMAKRRSELMEGRTQC